MMMNYDSINSYRFHLKYELHNERNYSKLMNIYCFIMFVTNQNYGKSTM